MRKTDIADKAQIKQMLRARGVLGIANGQTQRSGVLQLWWYNIKDDVCNRCESRWPDTGREIESVSLNKALKILWRNRSSLYLCGKRRGNGHLRGTGITTPR